MIAPGPRAPLRIGMLAAALLLGSCIETGRDPFPRRDPAPTRTPGNGVTIGLVASITGPTLFPAEDALEGADLAVNMLNRERDGDAPPFELLTLDDHGDPTRARRLVAELAASGEVAGIVYAGPPEALPAVEAHLAEAGIPAVLVYGDLYTARRLRPHLFQASPPLLWQARRLLAYALRDRRYERVGALVEDSFTGRTAVAAVQAAAADHGPATPPIAFYAAGSDLRPHLRRLRARGVEALVVQAGASEFVAVMRTLDRMGANYRTTAAARIASAPRATERRRRRTGWWHPQVLAFDLALDPRARDLRLPPGTIVADTYARGAHYLPIPSIASFREAFRAWWDAPPTGLELRAYEAARLIGDAYGRAPDGDRAAALETVRGARFGGLRVVLGPDDHTTVEQTSIGLWVVPRPAARVRERGRLFGLPYVPLARTFSIDGRRTQIDSADWRYLFRRPPPPTAPAPPFRRMRFGVTTPRTDPVH